MGRRKLDNLVSDLPWDYIMGRYLNDESAYSLAKEFNVSLTYFIEVLKRLINNSDYRIKAKLKKEKMEDRFWGKVDILGKEECWFWTAKTSSGRGSFYLDNTSVPVPRMAYILTKGIIGAGLDIVQSCRNSLCVNPNHLIASPRHTNKNGTHRNATKETCPKGHLYDSIIETATGPRRRCKICHSLQEKLRRNCGTDSTIKGWQEKLGQFNYKCVYCGALWEHMDHFIPLSMGGLHTLDNVVPSCRTCNLQKGNKAVLEFIGCS